MKCLKIPRVFLCFRMTESKSSLTHFSSFTLSGKDSHDFVQRIFTRNIASLDPHYRACLLLEPNGKLVSWFWIAKQTPDQLEIIVESSQHQDLCEGIDRYHFAEDIQLSEASPIFLPPTNDLTEERLVHFRSLSFKADRQEPKGACLGQPPCEDGRIQERLPFATKDSIQSRLVFEIGMEDFCDRNKGCYVGQEVVERVLSRSGSAPQKLSCLQSDNQPECGLENLDVLNSEGKVVGQTTSSVSKTGTQTKVLAYIKSKELSSKATFYIENKPLKARFYAV